MVRINILGDEPEPEAFGEAAKRLLLWSNNVTCDLHVMPRTADGWLEYGLEIKSVVDGERNFYIGMIQRTPGAPWEFHS